MARLENPFNSPPVFILLIIWTTIDFGTSSSTRKIPMRICLLGDWRVSREFKTLHTINPFINHAPQTSPDVPKPGGSFLKEMTKFDNIEFGVSSKDALAMTSTTRRIIEMSFLALLDAGIDSRTQRVGSFMTGTNVEYFEKVIPWLYLACSVSCLNYHGIHRTLLMTEALPA